MKKYQIIKKLLRDNGLTCQQVAESMGCHYAYLSYLLNGKRNFSKHLLKKYYRLATKAFLTEKKRQQQRLQEIEEILAEIERDLNS